jgi:hypothetical protein
VRSETAGDPMGEQCWTRSSLRRLSRRLGQADHPASPPTVGRLLRQQHYALHGNAKQKEGPAHLDRDQQFQQIERTKESFQAAGQPILSVDTKKELMGDLNAGRVWGQQAEEVNVHDFPSEALGRATPYGLYDLTHNQGWVGVGTSADTPQFAVAVIARWWEQEGRRLFPTATELLILAVTVCHYPTGCSKWNPIEHRLFNHISLNWAGRPLRSWETMPAYIRGATTTTGLIVQAFLLEGEYPKGQRVSDAEMDQLNLERHEVCPKKLTG